MWIGINRSYCTYTQNLKSQNVLKKCKTQREIQFNLCSISFKQYTVTSVQCSIIQIKFLCKSYLKMPCVSMRSIRCCSHWSTVSPITLCSKPYQTQTALLHSRLQKCPSITLCTFHLCDNTHRARNKTSCHQLANDMKQYTTSMQQNVWIYQQHHSLYVEIWHCTILCRTYYWSDKSYSWLHKNLSCRIPKH